MNLTQTKNEVRRRMVLKALAESPDYMMSDELLRQLYAAGNFQVAQVGADLSWLADAELIVLKEISDMGESVRLARLTPRGLDVAQSRAVVPGVAKLDIGG